MRTDSGRTVSVWMATADTPSAPQLTADASADVCVVGAGIAGMTTAYLLVRAGKRVIVLDDGPIGGGETSRTTAHLSNALDDRYSEIARLHGEEGTRLAAESHTAAINRIEMIVRQEAIDCDFERVDGYLFLARGDKPDLLDREIQAAHDASLVDVERVARAPVSSFDTGPCLRFPRQGQFHPLRYLAGLARAITRDGGQIYSGAHVESIEGESALEVTTSSGRTVRAGACVVATNSPISDLVVTHVKQAAYRTFVIGVRVPPGALPHVLLWDTGDPYHYVRVQRIAGDDDSPAYDVLIVGGEDHKTGQDDDSDKRFRRLESWTRERFPMAGEVEFEWSGQVMEPFDYLALIGKNPGKHPNVYIATGDSGMGMTHGTIAGILLTDLIMGRDNPWATLYDPSRITLGVAAASEFAKENINVAVQYAKDLLGPGDVKSAEEIEPGTGAVIRRGVHRIAAYRNESGTLHERSALCTHLKCVVHWNSMESSWDCPCHGSRFDAYGTVLNGPAITPLEPAADDAESTNS